MPSRALTALALLMALPATAEQFALTSQVTEAELYPQGASLIREAGFDLPAGTHELVIADLPLSVPLDDLRVAAPGLTIGTVTLRRDALPPRDPAETPAVIAAKAEIERLEEEITAQKDRINLAGARATAAQLALDALARVQLGDTDPATLPQMSAAIAQSAETAAQDLVQAQTELRPLNAVLKELRADLADAQAALAALQPDQGARGMITVQVTTAEAASGTLRLSYLTEAAAWRPAYDLHLDRAEKSLRIERGALIEQSTGEPWQDVQIAMSTARPSGATAPSQLWPELRRVENPQELAETYSMRAATAAPQVAMDREAASFKGGVAEITEGLRTRYTYDAPISVASGADALRIALGNFDLDPEIFVRAVPSRDTTGFMAASFENSTGETILPAQAAFYLDGTFTGNRWLDQIPAGSKAELGFGPVEGIQLRQILRANEGDRGLLSSRSERREEAVYEVKNQTGLPWDIRMLAQVPYSEQEDLRITWEADPMPDERNLDDAQGILEWRFTLPAQDTKQIELIHRLRWPEGMELR